MEKQVYKVHVNKYGGRHWYQQGNLHRVDGPACEYANGDRSWYQNGKLHRVDGPAIEYKNGTRYWFQNGKYHRVDGPTIECANGYRAWHQNDKYHRVNGPAVEYPDGTKEYWIDGKQLTEAKFYARTKPACNGKEVMIDGKKYHLTSID